jgi:hypothetical protein
MQETTDAQRGPKEGGAAVDELALVARHGPRPRLGEVDALEAEFVEVREEKGFVLLAVDLLQDVVSGEWWARETVAPAGRRCRRGTL